MSMVNADSVQLFAMLKKMQDSISSIETTKKSVKMKYEQLGAGWQDKKYNELGVVVRDCNKALNDILQMEYLQAHLRPVVLLLHHQVQIQPPLSQIPLVLILHLFKTDYQLNDIFPVEITMKNIEIIGRTGTIPFLEMKIQNSYTLEQGILKEFISVTENLGTRKDFGHGMVERDGREKTF